MSVESVCITKRKKHLDLTLYSGVGVTRCWFGVYGCGYVDVDVAEIRAHADASMPATNNNSHYSVYYNF